MFSLLPAAVPRSLCNTPVTLWGPSTLLLALILRVERLRRHWSGMVPTSVLSSTGSLRSVRTCGLTVRLQLFPEPRVSTTLKSFHSPRRKTTEVRSREADSCIVIIVIINLRYGPDFTFCQIRNTLDLCGVRIRAEGGGSGGEMHLRLNQSDRSACRQSAMSLLMILPRSASQLSPPRWITALTAIEATLALPVLRQLHSSKCHFSKSKFHQ
ncbi:hypothetical protein F2P81_016877 [Scophthalmus maximus]|uniref:Uncharacterized protein n=1 Tax=Scophthalmus maximus TaxID=52904 RepID=A0A6A4S4M2_SCOMX|nr:hypothetical protein F2P81_016877 [Scophthalmus maximus]